MRHDSADGSSDDEDEAAELMRELEKIKKERVQQKEKEEQERAAEAEEKREYDIARGNPLLNSEDFSMKRRWDDDVVFKNQARGTENGGDGSFVNVCPLRRRLSSMLISGRTCCVRISTRDLWYAQRRF